MLVLGIGIAYNYLSNIHGARSSLLGYKTNPKSTCCLRIQSEAGFFETKNHKDHCII